MQLVEITESDKSKYNQFVADSPTGSFLQSWEWGVWQEALGRKVKRFKILDDSENQVASIQIVLMPLPFGKFYVYVPFGPVVSEKYKVESEKLFEALKKQFSRAIFIRLEPKAILNFHTPAANLQIRKSANIQPAKTLVINLEKSEEVLLAEMHPKTRYNIRLAQKHGVQIQDEFEVSVGNGLFFSETINLLVQTAKRQGFLTYQASYYHNLINVLAIQNRGDLKLHIYKALYQNKLLACAIMLDFSAGGGSLPLNSVRGGQADASGGGTRTYLFGGTAGEYKNVMAPYLLHFRAMLDAKKLGLKLYDFWGIETAGGSTPGFVRFKLGFSSSVARESAPVLSVQSKNLEPRVEEISGSISGVKTYGGAYDIVCVPGLYTIYGLARKLNRLLSGLRK